jgi:4'-phosphopantetheinyl transferase
MDVYWLEQSEVDVPTGDDWLSESEVARLSSLRFPKRRADWRLGRWTAKCGIAASLGLGGDRPSLREIEISAAATGQPEVTLVEGAEAVTISLSHRDGIAICAVARGSVMLGCDLEVVETRSDAFTADYFTLQEQEVIAETSEERRPLLVTLLWSAKESVLKARHVGLRADTRSVAVNALDWPGHWLEETEARAIEGDRPPESASTSIANWRQLQLQCADGADFRGWWQHAGNTVRTIVSVPPPAAPIELGLPANAVRTSWPA